MKKLTRNSAIERFLTKTNRTESCWLWEGGKTKGGYGTFKFQRRTVMAHRFAYESFVGTIPEGLHLDHLCRVRHCVNPAHLEPVANRENVLRGDTIPARNAVKTHCPQGHEYSEVNTYIHPDGRRTCRMCQQRHDSLYKARIRQESQR